MGTFSVEATVANLADPTMRVTLGLLVDTGATWTTLPGDVAADIGAAQLGVRRVRLADGRVEEWPIGPRGGPSLLGAVTLEELGLAVDPAARRLVPATGYLMSLAV